MAKKLCLAHIKSNLKFSQIIWLNFEKLTYRTFQNGVFQKYINSLSELHAHVKAARERCGGHACREQADGQHHQQHQVEQRQRHLQQIPKQQNILSRLRRIIYIRDKHKSQTEKEHPLDNYRDNYSR